MSNLPAHEPDASSGDSSDAGQRRLGPVSAPPMATLPGFLARFVVPLLGGPGVGGDGHWVEVHAPMSSADREAMLASKGSGALLSSEFSTLRTRAAQRLVAEPHLPDPNVDELSLWLGLHGVLALDHPDISRVWTRSKTWQRVETETRALLAFARPRAMDEALARHLAVGAFLELRRVDHIVATPDGELRYRGQAPPRRRFSLFGAEPVDVRSESVRWIERPHRAAVQRLLPDVMWVSPLTALLAPGWAPPGWSPLMAATFLRSRPYARAVCHTWAREREWVRLGGIVAGSLLRTLDLVAEVFADKPGPGVPGVVAAMRRDAGEGSSDEGAPEAGGAGEAGESEEAARLALPAPKVEFDRHDVGAVLGALIHLHLIKVLEFDARISIGLSARDWAVQTFLALPLLLSRLEPVLGSPLDELALADESFARRWEEYREHLAGLVPRTVVENLVATLVQRVVQRHPQ